MKPGSVARVSQIVKTLAAIALVTAAILVWYLRRDRPAASAQPAPVAGPGSSAQPVPPPGAAPPPPAHVRRVTAEERAQLAAQIANARAGRTAPAAVPTDERVAPTLPSSAPISQKDDPEGFRTSMKAAMREVVPILAECYDKATDLPAKVSVVTKLRLVGDPDIGTLIDTDGVTDDKEAALPAAFDLCLRDSLASLQLPPLAEGEEVSVTYPLLFTR